MNPIYGGRPAFPIVLSTCSVYTLYWPRHWTTNGVVQKRVGSFLLPCSSIISLYPLQLPFCNLQIYLFYIPISSTGGERWSREMEVLEMEQSGHKCLMERDIGLDPSSEGRRVRLRKCLLRGRKNERHRVRCSPMEWKKMSVRSLQRWAQNNSNIINLMPKSITATLWDRY